MVRNFQKPSPFHRWENMTITIPSPQKIDHRSSLLSEYDGTQNFKRYRYRYFFPVPNIYDTDTGTFFRYQIFPIPVPGLFPVPNFSDTGSETFFRYHFFSIPVPKPREKMNNSWYREFSFFLVVSEPVSEKFGTGKKYRYRYRKNLVPEKSTGIGIGKIWYRKKVSEPVSEKFGTGKSIGTGTGKKLI